MLLPCSVFSAVNQCLEKGLENIHHDQEVRSIGTIVDSGMGHQISGFARVLECEPMFEEGAVDHLEA